MMTNAQAALQAAASMYSTGASAEEEIAIDSVLMDADKFKEWLDDHDRMDRNRKGTPKMTRESASEHYGTPPSPPRGSETTVAHPDVDRYMVS